MRCSAEVIICLDCSTGVSAARASGRRGILSFSGRTKRELYSETNLEKFMTPESPSRSLGLSSPPFTDFHLTVSAVIECEVLQVTYFPFPMYVYISDFLHSPASARVGASSHRADKPTDASSVFSVGIPVKRLHRETRQTFRHYKPQRGNLAAETKFKSFIMGIFYSDSPAVKVPPFKEFTGINNVRKFPIWTAQSSTVETFC